MEMEVIHFSMHSSCTWTMIKLVFRAKGKGLTVTNDIAFLKSESTISFSADASAWVFNGRQVFGVTASLSIDTADAQDFKYNYGVLYPGSDFYKHFTVTKLASDFFVTIQSQIRSYLKHSNRSYIVHFIRYFRFTINNNIKFVRSWKNPLSYW